jgi:hypothetical protein
MTTTINILWIDDGNTVPLALGQALAADQRRVVPAENGCELLSPLTALASHQPVIGMTARFDQPHSSSIAGRLDATMESPPNLAVHHQGTVLAKSGTSMPASHPVPNAARMIVRTHPSP